MSSHRDRSRLTGFSPAVLGLLGGLGLASIPAPPRLEAQARFTRGDVDGDGRVGLPDALAAVDAILGRPSRAACLDAADLDDDGVLATADAVRLLAFLFSGAAPPPPPYPACGPDGTGDGLGCDRHDACRDEPPEPGPPARIAIDGGDVAGASEAGGLSESVDRARSTLRGSESRELPAARTRGGGAALGRRIALGEVVAGEIASRSQADVYTFAASRGQRIAVDRLSASSPGGLEWRLEDVWGRALASNLNSLDDLPPVAVLGGDYTLTVLPEGSGTGTYSFRVVDASDAPTVEIAVGDTVAGEVHPDHPGERDRYAFSVPPGRRVFLDAISSGSAGLRWRVEDAFDRQVVPARSLADFGPLALVGGDYRLTVEGPLSSGNLPTGAYQFRIVGLDDPEPTPLGGLGEIVSGEISLPGDLDAYTVTVAAGQAVFLEAIASSNAAVLNWEIVDRVGRAVLPRTTSLVDLGPIALAGGEYQVRILGEGGGTATYQVRVTDANPSPPTGIALGDEVTGEIPADRPGVARAYELSAAAGKQITLELIQSSNAGAFGWEILDVHGRSVLPRTTSIATVGPIPLVGGAYRILVVPEGAATGTYRFRVRDDGTVAYSPTGDPVAAGDEVSSAVATPGGEARYTLQAASGDRIYVDLLEGHADLDWELLDPVGRSFGSKRGNSTDAADLGPYALAAGTYTLWLRARTGTATPTFRFRIAGAPAVVADAALDEVISGDFAGAAGSSRLFRIAVGEGQEVFLDRLAASPRLEWALLDPAGTEVLSLRRADGVDDDAGPFVLTAGTYTLVLDPQFGYEPSYELVVRSVASATSSLAIGETVVGSFAGGAGSVQRFTFAAAEGERLFFDRVTARSALRLDWRLVDPVGESLFGPTRADSVDADAGPFALAAGMYTLLFDPQAGAEPTYDFRVLRVDDAVGPLVFDATTSGALAPGATATYELDATDGRRVFFDLVTTGPFLRWSFVDELGEAIFRDVNASSPASDLGPYDLREGRYRLVVDATASNVPAYAFTALDVAVDLGIDDLWANERVFFAGDSRRDLTVTWWARNAGGGPQAAGPATDRLVVSTDAVFGNADDILLGDFVRFEPVAPHGTYARTATVEVPDTLPVGTYRLLVVLDAEDVLEEPAGESDNVGILEILVVEDLPPVEPEFIETTSFPVAFVASGAETSIDVPLARSVSLDSIRYVHVEAASIALSGPRGDTGSSVTLLLLGGRDEVLEVATSSPSAGSGAGSFVARFSRRLEPRTVALLPSRLVDGIRLRVDQPSTTSTTLGSIHADGRLRLYFAGCEFAPCGPHLERRSPGAESLTFQGTGRSEWVTALFDEPVEGDGLRFVSGPRFSATTTFGLGIAAASSEAQLILDDGTLRTLDDSRSPSTLGTLGFALLSADHGLSLDPSALAGRRILGLQWRIAATYAGIGSVTSFYEPLDDLAVRFLYEADSCGGTIAIPPVELSPPDGSAFAPGSLVTLSGRALAPQVGRPVSAVLVDGAPVDSLDAAGRFFKTVQVGAGENLFVVGVVEPGCGEHETILRLRGLPDGTSGLDGYEEAGAQLRVEYADTTFRRATDDLIVRARVRNVSRHPVRGPILMALVKLRPETAEARAAAGVTEQGEPFVVLLEGGILPPGEAGPWASLPFRTPGRERVEFDVRWLVPSNRPPHFESAPPSRAVAGSAWEYRPAVADPDGDAAALRLDHGPSGMALDAARGSLSWTPGPADVGTHDVSLAAGDSLGGEASQRWTLTVVAASANRPPFFTSAPALGAAVGGPYAYDAEAEDPEGDPIAYVLLEGPAGLALGETTGELRWDHALPGAHAVSLEARDAAGASARQDFVLSVGTAPSNPSAPRITTSPATEAVAGVLFVYQPVVSDPDGDPPAYSLLAAPEGMTVDPATGRIEWTPTLDQVGSHPVTVRVTDGRGGETRQSFTVVVAGATSNLPPVIESVPPGHALAGAPYRYDADAIDPEGEPLAFSLAGAPAGMSIDAGTGLLEWTPAAGDVGTKVVTVRAADARGGAGSQAFELRVRAGNAPPALVSAPPPASVLAGATWQHDLDADDPDADLLRYELSSGPDALSVQPVTGLATWRTTPADVGIHEVVVRAADCCGGVAERSFRIEVLPDTEPPAVAIGFDPNPSPVGAVVEVTVSASDDVAVSSRALEVECAPSPPVEVRLDELGRGTFASAATGYCICTATARDPSGNETVATAVLQVGNPDDPLDPHPPVVTILSPTPGSILTAPASIVATIADATEAGRPGSGPIAWTVELAPAGGGFEALGAGSGEETAGLLATLDPTLRPNGLYRLRVVASDGVQTGGVEMEVSIAGDLKLGDFTTAFVDLAMPLAGLPIVISRHYSSLDPSPGDFGPGWRLGLPGQVEDSALESTTGDGLVDLLASEPFHPGTRVYVTRADGQRVGFTFAPRSLGGMLAYLWQPAFDPDPGVEDTLEVVEPAGSFFLFGGNANQVGVPYNPSVYRLETREGVRYVVGETEGLLRMEDRNGNGIAVTRDGLVSDLGPSIAFERGSDGRIARIVETGDPEDPVQSTYAYDDAGNLATVVDAYANTTRYFYEDERFPRYLTRVDDALGRPLIRSVYDDQGRLLGLCGAGGDTATLEGCTTVDWDPGARASTTIDARGFRVERAYDERGRVLLERRWLDEERFLESRSEYDEEGNLVLDVDASGEEWTYDHDDRGRLLAMTDPLGRTTRMTWDPCDQPATETAPDGSTIRYRSDPACNLVAIEQPTGGAFGFAHDEYGDRTEIVDPVGNRWRMEYGPDGHLAKVVDPRGGEFLVRTNRAGDVLSRTDPDGRRVDYAYDDARRPIRETWNTVPPRVFSYDYDAAGQLVRASDGESEVRIDYLPTGLVSRVVTEGGGAGPTVTIDYEHDANGNVVRMTDSLGGTTTWDHDGAGRVLSIRQSGGSVREKRVDAVWSEGSSLVELRRFADLAGAVPVASTSWEYACESCDDGPVAIVHRRSADGSVIHEIALERDALGLVAAATDAEGRHTYSYDASRRLVAATHPSGGVQPDERYEYDEAGNRTASHRASYVHGYAAAGGNQIESDGSHRYEVDGAGNVTRRIDLATGASTEYVYDHRYRLTEVIEKDPGGAEVRRTSWAWDATDRRIRSTEDGVVTHTVYDGLNPILVLDEDGSVLRRRLYARGLDAILADEAAGATRWLLTDQVGTVRDVVGDDGLPLAHFIFDSFGVLLAGAVPTAAGGLGFTARELSAATGLYSLRGREYDPALGRFLRPDPLEPFQYDYALSSPLSFIDPNGQAGRRPPRPIDRPPWLRPPPPKPPSYPGGAYGPSFYNPYNTPGPKRSPPARRPPRGHAGGEFAEYATLLDGISLPAVLGGFTAVAGATAVALNGVVIAYALWSWATM